MRGRNLLVIAWLSAGFGPVMGQDRNYTVTYSGAQVNYLRSLLGKQPHDDVAALIYALETAVNQQNQASQNSAIEAIRNQAKKEAEAAASKEKPDGPPPPGQ